jgi:hypothetical protein
VAIATYRAKAGWDLCVMFGSKRLRNGEHRISIYRVDARRQKRQKEERKTETD